MKEQKVTFQDKSINLAGFMVNFLLDEEGAGNASVTKSILENIQGHKSIAKSPYFWRDRCDLSSSARIHAANVHKFLIDRHWKKLVTRFAEENGICLGDALTGFNNATNFFDYCMRCAKKGAAWGINSNIFEVCVFMYTFEIGRNPKQFNERELEVRNRCKWMYELPNSPFENWIHDEIEVELEIRDGKLANLKPISSNHSWDPPLGFIDKLKQVAPEIWKKQLEVETKSSHDAFKHRNISPSGLPRYSNLCISLFI